MFTRSLLKLGKDAGATLVESYIGADGAKTYQVHDSAARLRSATPRGSIMSG